MVLFSREDLVGYASARDITCLCALACGQPSTPTEGGRFQRSSSTACGPAPHPRLASWTFEQVGLGFSSIESIKDDKFADLGCKSIKHWF